MIIKEIVCGSQRLFGSYPDFKPRDLDVIRFTDNEEPYIHDRTEEGCVFNWGVNKRLVKKYVIDFPYYFTSTVLVFKEFVDYYGFTYEEVVEVIDRVKPLFANHRYSYFVPLFDYIKENKSWDFPKEVLDIAYKRYRINKNIDN